ncbi:MAG: hypothetical protein HZC28_19370 [Spirochaetes bacterium]|nr:hypothetical protein [Spirochaetota bacterium]
MDERTIDLATNSLRTQLSPEKKREIVAVMQDIARQQNQNREKDIRLHEDQLYRKLFDLGFTEEEIAYTIVVCKHLFPIQLLSPFPNNTALKTIYKDVIDTLAERKQDTVKVALKALQMFECDDGKVAVREENIRTLFQRRLFTEREAEYGIAVLKHYFPRNFGDKRSGSVVNSYFRYFFELYYNDFFLTDGLGKWFLVKEAQKQEGKLRVLLNSIRFIDQEKYGMRPKWWTAEQESRFIDTIYARLDRDFIIPARKMLTDRNLLKGFSADEENYIRRITDVPETAKKLVVEYKRRQFMIAFNRQLTDTASADMEARYPQFLKEALKLWVFARYELTDDDFLTHASQFARCIRRKCFPEQPPAKDGAAPVKDTAAPLSAHEVFYLARILALLSTLTGEALRLCNDYYKKASNEFRKQFDDFKKLV